VLRRIDSINSHTLARLRKSQVIVYITETLTMSYNPFSNAIWVPREELERLDVDVLACRFVHEATHARVARTIRTTRRNLERVEHVSLDQEIQMLERIVLAGTTMPVIHYLTSWRQNRTQPNASQMIRKERIKQELETLKPPRVLRWLIYRFNGISSDTNAAA
jgi:hypothetical protein